MAAPFAGFVRVPRIEHHDDGGDGIGRGEQKSVLHRAEIFRLQAVREKSHAAVGRRVVQKIHDDHHQDFAPREPLPEGNFCRRLQLRRLALQRGFQKVFFLRGNPFRLARMVADEKPPDRQPDERQRAFQNQHGLPAIRAEQPAGDRRGRDHRERLAQIPKARWPARVRRWETSARARPASRETRSSRRRRAESARFQTGKKFSPDRSPRRTRPRKSGTG